MDKIRSGTQHSIHRDWLKVDSQGPLLFRLSICALICIVLLIFIINYPANLPLWRFYSTELALALLLALNIFWINPKLSSAQSPALNDWAFLVISALLILTVVWLSGHFDVVYLLSIVCIQADFKRGV